MIEGDPIRAATELRRRLAAALVFGAAQCGEHLLGEAQRLAPIEEGTLRGAATLAFNVNGAEIQTQAQAEAAAVAALAAGQHVEVTAVVRFELPYAARQHEEMEWNHPRGGQAKYLEQPLNANAGRYATILEKAQRVALASRQ